MRVLITGISGFVGSILAEFLLNDSQHNSLEIHGTVHRADSRIQPFRDRLRLHKGDLRNPSWIEQVVETVRPQLVFHLAAWSDVRASWDQPWATYELNIGCQLNLLEALLRHAPDARVLVVASSEVYGLIGADDLPVSEDTPLRPNSPYGISKVAQDLMAQQYWFNFQAADRARAQLQSHRPGSVRQFRRQRLCPPDRRNRSWSARANPESWEIWRPSATTLTCAIW